jgi:hypothetical protein
VRFYRREGVSEHVVQGTGTQPVRNCYLCIFCQQDKGLWLRTLASGFPVLGLCANQPQSPGLMRPVPSRACRNFRCISRPKGLKPPVPPDETIRYIPLTRGLYAIVDAKNYEWLSQYKWSAMPPTRAGKIYAQRASPNGRILMHREIMRTPRGMVVDHIDGNGLHNREENLRNCTQSENTQNSRPRDKAGTRFKGVYPQGKKWKAMVRYKSRDHRVGTFDDEVEAASARDRKALELFGQFAWLNFPELRDELTNDSSPRKARRVTKNNQ